jgi:hypothetical protein
MASYQPYGSFAQILASLKNRSQLTGTKYTKRDINNIGSGYFSDALNATNAQRAYDLQSASQTLAEKAQAAQEAQSAASLALSGQQFDIQQAQSADQFNKSQALSADQFNKSQALSSGQFDTTQATSTDQFAQTLAEQKRIADAQQNAGESSNTLQDVGTGLSAAMTGAKVYDWLGGPSPSKLWSGTGPTNAAADTAIDVLGETSPFQAEPVVNLGQTTQPLTTAKDITKSSAFTVDAPAVAETAQVGNVALNNAVSTAEPGMPGLYDVGSLAAPTTVGAIGGYNAAGVGVNSGMSLANNGMLMSGTEAAATNAGLAAGKGAALGAAPAAAGETLGSVLGPIGAAYALWDLGVSLGGGKSPSGAAVNQLIEQVPNVVNQAGGQISQGVSGFAPAISNFVSNFGGDSSGPHPFMQWLATPEGQAFDKAEKASIEAKNAEEDKRREAVAMANPNSWERYWESSSKGVNDGLGWIPERYKASNWAPDPREAFNFSF